MKDAPAFQITVSEHGATLISVAGVPIGLVHSVDFSVDSTRPYPSCQVRLVGGSDADKYAEQLRAIPWVQVEQTQFSSRYELPVV